MDVAVVDLALADDAHAVRRRDAVVPRHVPVAAGGDGPASGRKASANRVLDISLVAVWMVWAFWQGARHGGERVDLALDRQSWIVFTVLTTMLGRLSLAVGVSFCPFSGVDGYLLELEVLRWDLRSSVCRRSRILIRGRSSRFSLPP